MADTTPLAPTDAELDALIDQHRWDATTGRRAIARAVLARWGAQQMPASAAEFALNVLVAAGHVSQELVDRALALPGAPQPVARAPLTDEQIDQAIAELGLNYLADAHATNRAVLRKLCRHANGIT